MTVVGGVHLAVVRFRSYRLSVKMSCKNIIFNWQLIIFCFSCGIILNVRRDKEVIFYVRFCELIAVSTPIAVAKTI